MAAFIILFQFTEQGVKNFRQSPDRSVAFREAAQKAGIMVKDIYWTLGEYDGVIILEAKDDEAVAGLLLAVGALGNIRTRSMRAFNGSELKSIIAKVPQ